MEKVQGGYNKPEQAAVMPEVLAEEWRHFWVGPCAVLSRPHRESQRIEAPAVDMAASTPHWGRHSDRLSLGHKGLAPGTPGRPSDSQTHSAGLDQPYGYNCSLCVSTAFLCPHWCQSPHRLFCLGMLISGFFLENLLCVLCVHNEKMSFRTVSSHLLWVVSLDKLGNLGF